MRHRLLVSHLVFITSLAAAVAVGAPTNAATSSNDALLVSRPPQAVDDYRIAPRADSSARAWNKLQKRYTSSYVNPTSWSVTLNGCKSKAGTDSTGHSKAITRWSWVLQPMAGQTVAPIRVNPVLPLCSTSVHLPKLGAWKITLTVRDTLGRTSTAVSLPTFRDVLIVGIGDSLASGEGNPSSGWTDDACHRSRNAWPQQVARNFVENFETTVTFLSYACSGATLRHLYATTQSGAAPQVLAARRDIGAPTGTSTRRVDALLLSGGVNDLDFSTVLKQCLSDCPNIDARFTPIPGRYATLDHAIRANLKVAHVFAADYPARIFTNAADQWQTCELFQNVSVSDAMWVTAQGLRLDSILAAAATTNHWTVTSTTDAFRHHGYCAGSTSWFRTFLDSLKLQGDENGTAHPTYGGHYRIAQLVSARVKAAL
jgi:GDSL-like Lipase/Acylhydrolase family